MASYKSTVITGTGREIPDRIVSNGYFLGGQFFHSSGAPLNEPTPDSLDKFTKITRISERRYANDEDFTSDIGYRAAVKALESSEINREELDYILFAHNFGDVTVDGRINTVPTLATKVKGKLEIRNRKTEPRDVPFGCPGWVQTLIDANRYFRAGDGSKALTIGAEILSRVKDPCDRDGPIYADGGAAAVVEYKEFDSPRGILGYSVDSGDATEVVKGKNKKVYQIMGMRPTYGPNSDGRLFFKMEDGSDVFIYAKGNVPPVIGESITKSGLHMRDINKILLHQANGKMDEAMLMKTMEIFGVKFTRKKEGDNEFYYADKVALNENIHPEVFSELQNRFDNKDRYELQEISSLLMPMTISWLANSSVATVPTLLDLLLRGKLEGHTLKEGDNIVLASVGAGGPNANSIVYRMAGCEFVDIRGLERRVKAA